MVQELFDIFFGNSKEKWKYPGVSITIKLHITASIIITGLWLRSICFSRTTSLIIKQHHPKWIFFMTLLKTEFEMNIRRKGHARLNIKTGIVLFHPPKCSRSPTTVKRFGIRHPTIALARKIDTTHSHVSLGTTVPKQPKLRKERKAIPLKFLHINWPVSGRAPVILLARKPRMLVTTRCGEPEAPKKAPPSLDNRAESPPLLVLESSGVATVVVM